MKSQNGDNRNTMKGYKSASSLSLDEDEEWEAI
jgi:hypothetical protein